MSESICIADGVTERMNIERMKPCRKLTREPFPSIINGQRYWLL